MKRGQTKDFSTWSMPTFSASLSTSRRSRSSPRRNRRARRSRSRPFSPERDALEIRFPRVEGYRVELPEERLTADFNKDLSSNSALIWSAHLSHAIRASSARAWTSSSEHLGDMRPSALVFNLTHRLLYTKWRDPGEEPKLHLFGQLKRIAKQWLDTCLVCKGGTYPALLMYQELADMACNRITAAITRQFLGERPIEALLDPYNPTGSTRHVRFNTSRADRWETERPAAEEPCKSGRDRTAIGRRNSAASLRFIPK